MVIFSKNIVMEDDIVEGYITVEENKITDITSFLPKKIDSTVINLEDEYILPGIINVDSHNVSSESDDKITLFALRNIEYSAALNGVTTLYHTIYYSEIDGEKYQKCNERIYNIYKYNDSPLSLINNKVHLKFEVKSSQAMDDIKKLIDEKRVDLLSFDLFMNRKRNLQLKDEYIHYYIQTKFDITSEKAGKILDRIKELREDSNIEEMSYILKIAHHKNIRTSTSQIKLSENIQGQFKDGFDIINITKENKKSIKKNCDKFIRVQADDILNLTIKDIEKKFASSKIDFITSGNRSSNILMSIFKLARIMPLKDTIKYVTSNSAVALGINDSKGYIKKGYDADIISVKVIEQIPVVSKLFSNGIEKISVKNI